MDKITLEQVIQVVDGHDKFLFSLFIALSVLQETMVTKGIVTQEELKNLSEIRTKEALKRKFQADGLLDNNEELEKALS